MIFSRRASGHVKHVGFYTISYTQVHALGVGLSDAGKFIFFMLERIFSRMKSPRMWELLNGHWMAIRWEYLYSSSVGLHIVVLIPIWRYCSWFYFLQSKWNIVSENLLDEMTNLGIFTICLALSGCRPHTSSIWPWSGTPKVHLYNTFKGGLRHLPPQMKNQHELNEEKNHIGKKKISHLSACDVTRVVSLGTNN